jgi:pyruvate,water dikinase
MTHLPWLKGLDATNRSRYGGKAASLGALTRASFDVPPGFVIPVEVAARLRGAPGAWPAALKRDLLERLDALVPGREPVAVRSSAVDEDSESASFAGQYETVLGVAGHQEFLTAIKTCLASLDTEEARAYRARAGKTEAPAMAVVVQKMVQAEAAGVAFSVDPVTGDSSRIIVEAVPGLGDALVSGQAEGHRFVVDRDTLQIVERTNEPAALTDLEVLGVTRAAIRAADLFQSPQDIEFAMDHERKLWLLQSRPITVAGGGEDGAAGWQSEFDTVTSEADLWTSANVQEILPGLLTPLTITTFQETVPVAYTEDYHDLGLLEKDEHPLFMGAFYNRAFLNMEATRLVASRVIGMRDEAIEKRYLGGAIDDGWKNGLSRWKTWKHRTISTPRMLKMLSRIEHQAERAEQATRAMERRVRALNGSSLTDGELEEWRQRLGRFGARVARVHLRVTGIAGTGFDGVAELARPVLGDDTEGLAPVLFTGLHGVESAQIGVDLWELSRTCLAERLAARIQSPGFDPLDPSLPPSWRTRFESFIERHGHRGVNEMEASVRTWRWDYEPVLRMVTAYLDLPEDHSPPAVLARQEAERLRLTARIDAELGPVRRRVFRWLLPRAQKWVALREQTKSILVRASRLADYHVPEIQHRFVEAGIVRQPGDLFFLSTQEIAGVLNGAISSSLDEAVVRRKREYERNRYVVLPERFRGRPSPIPPEATAHAGDTLTGTPVSPGLVTGRARVILDPATDGPLEPGEILVAPVTDAGWTPLFALAAGLVVDMGSALSHGSTVAREYGLPAVVNVRSGTRRIRTGDIVTVNGSSGTVLILQEPD